MSRCLGPLVLGVTALSWPALARATYSITALDRQSGEVGGSGASCVPYSVDLIYGAIAGRGALNSQAAFVEELKAEALTLLGAGSSAEGVLAMVTDAAVYPESANSQWGVVDVRGGFASFTGPGARAFAGDLGRVSADGRFVFTVQGNLLTSRLVLEQAATAFEAGGCDLAERLMLGLVAASRGGEGDGRCTPEGRPAKSAYLDVTRPDGSAVHLGIPDVSPADPIAALRASYDSYRAEVPCPAPPTAVHRPDAAPGSGCSASGAHSPRGAGAPLALLALALVRRLRRLR